MGRRRKDLFGFEELQKQYLKCEQKYPNKADALLHVMAKQVNKEIKRNTPKHNEGYTGRERKPGTLRKSWKVQKPKKYKGGKIRVSRVYSADSVAHLIDLGHDIKPRGRGRKNRFVQSHFRYEKGKGAKGRVEGLHLRENALNKVNKAFDKGVQEMINELTKDIQV